MNNSQGKTARAQSPNTAPVSYEIKVQGLLDPERSKWFEGMTLAYVENGDTGSACTVISGAVIDQPALHGLLTKIRDLNLTLISVRRCFPGTSSEEEVLSRSPSSGK